MMIMSRIAGLRATDACLGPTCLCDIQQLCGRLMPQVCLLLVDKSSDVRELALTVLESCTAVVRTYHKEHKKLTGDEQSTLPPNTTSNHNDQGGNIERNQAPNSSGSGWTSWAVDGFSKSLEKVALDATVTPISSQAGVIPVVATVDVPKTNIPKNNDWGDDDLDFDDEPPAKPIVKAAVPTVKPTAIAMKENVDDEWSDNTPSVTPSKQKETAPRSKKTSKESAPRVTKLKEKPVQPSITKITTQTSDFDDWDDPPISQKPKLTPQPTTSVVAKDSHLDDDFDWGVDLDNIDLPPGEAWGAEDDLDLDLNVLGNNEVIGIGNPKLASASIPTASKTSTTCLPERAPSPISSPPSKAKIGGTTSKKEKDPPTSKKEKEPVSQSTSSKKPSKVAPVVKKLAVSSEGDNWDDF
jgi:hypothetical protein